LEPLELGVLAKLVFGKTSSERHCWEC